MAREEDDGNLSPAAVSDDVEKPSRDDSGDETATPAQDFPEGGLRAWMVAAGTGGILFCTLGYTNSFGVFQEYYMAHQLKHESSDRIAWIGSLQGFLIFASGAVGGPLFDRYGAKVIRPAAILYVFAVMMTSICKTYWQFMLAQGVLTGIADGLLMFPSMAATPQYFHKKRGAAMGIAIAGSSLGGVVFPIALGKMLNGSSSISFGWAVRICGFIMVPILTFSAVAIKARLPPRASRFFLLEAFRNRLYVLLILACFCLFIGLFVPTFFLPSFAVTIGVKPTLASYLVALFNAASIPGRILPGVLADKFGRLNMLFAAGVSTTIIVFCWTAVDSTAGVILYALAFGFSSGAIISGGSVAMTLCPSDPSHIGTYMGQGMALAATATLLGPPVTGVMLDKYGGFLEISMFAGAFCVVGSALIVLAKSAAGKGLFANV
ncbi:Riboflavin transporter MCH5 [Pleurostoma richardsiae]|uniref:Riboflavin transporter MCH5 n=1 Tax=Pleurostoma richardsiae TaxID=41990 RepID=A0AA38VNJ7_9PEZI|nr:Riboflavin transporter MCH5 [Pleurostoma richardsiae]